MNKDPFKEYIKGSEPNKRNKGYAWHTAIGLQAVDGLKTSEYLMHTAVRNIEGEISFEEANALLQTYYEEKSGIRWEYIGTKNFDLIYPDFYKYNAGKIAILFDSLYIHANSLNHRPGKMTMVIHAYGAAR